MLLSLLVYLSFFIVFPRLYRKWRWRGGVRRLTDDDDTSGDGGGEYDRDGMTSGLESTLVGVR